MTLKEAKQNIGRYVIYKPFLSCDKSEYEIGIITSANNFCVFVRYGNDSLSKATDAEDLTLK